MSRRPQIGELTAVVYAECLCGEWAMFGEGGILPVCGACGRRMTPGGGAPGQFGPADDPHYGRRQRGLAFVGMLTNENEGFGLAARLHQLLGLRTARMVRPSSPAPGPHFTASEVAGRLREYGFSVEPFWEGPPPWERPYVRRDTDEGEVVRGEWLQPAVSEEDPA